MPYIISNPEERVSNFEDNSKSRYGTLIGAISSILVIKSSFSSISVLSIHFFNESSSFIHILVLFLWSRSFTIFLIDSSSKSICSLVIEFEIIFSSRFAFAQAILPYNDPKLARTARVRIKSCSLSRKSFSKSLLFISRGLNASGGGLYSSPFFKDLVE